MPAWLDRWVFVMGLTSILAAGFAAIWPERSDLLIALANVLGWGAIGHAFYRLRLPLGR